MVLCLTTIPWVMTHLHVHACTSHHMYMHDTCMYINLLSIYIVRRRKLDEIKQRKLAELKAAGIPDKYCAEVSRRITAPPPSFTMSGLS